MPALSHGTGCTAASSVSCDKPVTPTLTQAWLLEGHQISRPSSPGSLPRSYLFFLHNLPWKCPFPSVSPAHSTSPSNSSCISVSSCVLLSSCIHAEGSCRPPLPSTAALPVSHSHSEWCHCESSARWSLKRNSFTAKMMPQLPWGHVPLSFTTFLCWRSGGLLVPWLF